VKNKRGIVFFLTAVLTATTLGTAFAQQQAAAPAAPPQAIRTAVVDMVVLLRAHPKLNADLKEFGTQQQGVVTHLRNVEKNIQDEAKIAMDRFKAGTSEYNQAMEELEKRMVELKTSQNKAQRELMIQDMKIKYEAFKTIREEIQRFSVPSGIAVVLDVRGIDPEADELTNAQEEVGQTVVWNASSVNITRQIVQQLNQRFQQFPQTANVVNGQVIFLNTNQNEAMPSPGPNVPIRPAPGAQPTAMQPGAPRN